MAGVLKPKMLMLNGSSKKAPESPPIEAKKEIRKATNGGIQKAISISSRLKFNCTFVLRIK